MIVADSDWELPLVHRRMKFCFWPKSNADTNAVVQSRSAFLFTAICAHGASLTAGAEEATKRLRIHTQRLADQISPRGFISVEVRRTVVSEY